MGPENVKGKSALEIGELFGSIDDLATTIATDSNEITEELEKLGTLLKERELEHKDEINRVVGLADKLVDEVLWRLVGRRREDLSGDERVEIERIKKDLGLEYE